MNGLTTIVCPKAPNYFAIYRCIKSRGISFQLGWLMKRVELTPLEVHLNTFNYVSMIMKEPCTLGMLPDTWDARGKSDGMCLSHVPEEC